MAGRFPTREELDRRYAESRQLEKEIRQAVPGATRLRVTLSGVTCEIDTQELWEAFQDAGDRLGWHFKRLAGPRTLITRKKKETP